jgi:hypothetical protein
MDAMDSFWWGDDATAEFDVDKPFHDGTGFELEVLLSSIGGWSAPTVCCGQAL